MNPVHDSHGTLLGFIEPQGAITQVFRRDGALEGFVRDDGTYDYEGARIALEPLPGLLLHSLDNG